MKEAIIIILSTTILIGGIIWAISYQESQYQIKCESKGGVVVESYYDQNCWKDGGYIKAE